MPPISELTTGSPEWWLQTLDGRLRKRNKEIKIYGDYYDGKHNLRYSSEGFDKEFLAFLADVRDNWCQLVVDAVNERMKVQGIRWGVDESRDEDAWLMWQSNRMDAEAPILHREMLIFGEASVLVNPFVAADEQPEITVEHPTQMIIAHAPGSRWKRAAAFKTFTDDYGENWAYLYMPDAIYRFHGRRKGELAPTDKRFGKWIPDEIATEMWPLANPVDVVPAVPFYNRTRMLAPPESEIKNVIPNQDMVNTFLRHLVLTSEFLSYPQRVIIGRLIGMLHENEDENGNPVPDADTEPTVNTSHHRFLTLEGEDMRIAEFSAASTDNQIKAIENRVQSVASQSRTPPHYFYLSGQFPSGETIKSAETGLVAKTVDKLGTTGESHEEVIRIGFKAKGDPRGDDMTAETIWGDPESRTESEMVDAAVKLVSIGLEQEMAWERVGMTPSQISRNKALREARLLNEALFGTPAPEESAVA